MVRTVMADVLSKISMLLLIVLLSVNEVSFAEEAPEKPQRMVVVSTYHSGANATSQIRGITDVMSKSTVPVVIERKMIRSYSDYNSSFWETLDYENCDLIITLGSRVGRFALQHVKNTPLILSGMMFPEYLDIPPGADVNIVSFDFTYDDHLSVLHEAFPWAKKVGFSYSGDREEVYRSVVEVSKRYDLQILGYEVESPFNVFTAKKNILFQSDILLVTTKQYSFAWSMDDGTRELCNIECYRYGKPLMSITSFALKCGASLCLLVDYEDIGRQGAELALHRLAKGPFPEPVILYPRKQRIVINESISSRLGIEYPDSILERAEIVGQQHPYARK